MRKALIIIVFLSGCTTYEPMPKFGTYDYSIWLAKHINVDDGIDQHEASILASAFFVSGISGCGAPAIPVLENGVWVAKTKLGYAGEPGEPIYINPVSGEVSWQEETLTFGDIRNLPYIN